MKPIVILKPLKGHTNANTHTRGHTLGYLPNVCDLLNYDGS